MLNLESTVIKKISVFVTLFVNTFCQHKKLVLLKKKLFQEDKKTERKILVAFISLWETTNKKSPLGNKVWLFQSMLKSGDKASTKLINQAMICQC